MSEAIIVNPIMAAHIFAGIGALTLGIFQVFFMPRGTKEHKKNRMVLGLADDVSRTDIAIRLGSQWLAKPTSTCIYFNDIYSVAFSNLVGAKWENKNS